MQVGDKVVCAFSNNAAIKTQQTYTVLGLTTIAGVPSMQVLDDEGNPTWVMCYRFMLESNVIEQVLENAKNG